MGEEIKSYSYEGICSLMDWASLSSERSKSCNGCIRKASIPMTI